MLKLDRCKLGSYIIAGLLQDEIQMKKIKSPANKYETEYTEICNDE